MDAALLPREKRLVNPEGVDEGLAPEPLHIRITDSVHASFDVKLLSPRSPRRATREKLAADGIAQRQSSIIQALTAGTPTAMAHGIRRPCLHTTTLPTGS
ncbi:MAG: hypothetical protein CSA62_00510 [Planctomycetota bacterium]|nr:MAG: hypothetical protein CSA62_00510 [Planctomycetota bacterium]